jgi:hypothetical protein
MENGEWRSLEGEWRMEDGGCLKVIGAGCVPESAGRRKLCGASERERQKHYA